jgi:TRAP transporter TAXI family solute receptor
MQSMTLHRWVVLLLLVAGVGSVLTWFGARDPLPATIRIATGEPGGLYHHLASSLRDTLQERSGAAIELVTTRGSLENLALLSAGEVDLALLQATSVPFESAAVVAPLYPEFVHVIVRRGGTLKSLGDLAGRRIVLGPQGSGMRESAKQLLAHYRINPDQVAANEGYFTALLEDATLEGAIVTTGIDNPDLARVLGSNRFVLLPVEDAEAISLRNSLFRPMTIPRGLYNEGPALPATDLPTIATTAMLVARADAGDAVLRWTLECMYGSDSYSSLPLSIPKHEALAASPLPLHPVARTFLNPYEGLDTVTKMIEALSGIKELLFGLVAFGYLIWDQRRRLKQRASAQSVAFQKERLDAYLARTVAIERAQIHTTDVAELNEFLDQITVIKLEAIEELTEEELRGDQMFSIFLAQCANLIRKIQSKILVHDKR